MATATASGLTTEEAARRLAEHGPNEPIPAVHASALLALLGRLLNPLVIILLIAAGFAAFLGFISVTRTTAFLYWQF